MMLEVGSFYRFRQGIFCIAAMRRQGSSDGPF
jgi:hypothetical protein